jgi:DNA-binding MarR family transcriptional regulator
MSAGVQALCDRGWAVKRPNPADARSSLVSLTTGGRTVLAEARRERADIVAARLRSDPRHTESDLATAVAVLRGLLQETDPDTDTEEGTE